MSADALVMLIIDFIHATAMLVLKQGLSGRVQMLFA